MEETQDPEASTAGGGTQQGRPDPEATSSETLSDIERGEKVAGGGGDSTASPLETSSPEPDAGGEGRADGSQTGGPM